MENNETKEAQELGIEVNEDLSEQISDLLLEDAPMSEEGYNEMLRKWQENNPAGTELPQIEKFSYSIRKDKEESTFIFTGNDHDPALYDPFAVHVGRDEGLDERTAMENRMNNFVVDYVRKGVEKRGTELGYALVTAARGGSNEQQSKNMEVIDLLKREAREHKNYLAMKEKLDSLEQNPVRNNSWAKINEDGDSHFAGISLGTATEANIVRLELSDPDAYICQTRIYTGENGFKKEEKKLVGEELHKVLHEEDNVRHVWMKEMNAVPAIGENRNVRKPTKKPKSIKRR